MDLSLSLSLLFIYFVGLIWWSNHAVCMYFQQSVISFCFLIVKA
jgi:hypothetical protein